MPDIKFMETVNEFNMIMPNDKIIVAVSGGADSMTLLHLLLQIKDKLDLEIIVAHLNHKLRGKSADRDENFVKEFCRSHKILFESKKISVEKFAKQTHNSIETAGRICRYDFFNELVGKYDADKIATAHNKNDDVETILMKLIRGSGNFFGIAPVNGKIIRPLINTSRHEIENYCRKNNLAYVTDQTNFECDFSRNKIRNKIIPLLTEINPAFIETFSRSAKIISEENYYLHEMANKFIKEHCPDKRSLPLKNIKSVPNVLLKKIIHIIIKDISKQNFSCANINSVFELVHKPNGKKIILPQDFIAEKCHNKIIFYAPKSQKKFAINININSPVLIPHLNKFFLLTDKKNPPCLTPEIKNCCTKSFYCDNINGAVVRNYQPGDKMFFEQLGHKLIKKIFSEKKLPQSCRSQVTVFAVDNDVIWLLDQKIDLITNRKAGQKFFIYVWEETNDERYSQRT